MKDLKIYFEISISKLSYSLRDEIESNIDCSCFSKTSYWGFDFPPKKGMILETDFLINAIEKDEDSYQYKILYSLFDSANEFKIQKITYCTESIVTIVVEPVINDTYYNRFYETLEMLKSN